MSRRRRDSGRRRGNWDDDWEPRREPRPKQGRDRRQRRGAGPERQPTPEARTALPVMPPAGPGPGPLLPVTTLTATCGRCREFLADELGGRGECLHPGSGILRPWWDTPGCPFFA